jgi:hypothetical protein
MSQLNKIDGSRQIKDASVTPAKLSFNPLTSANYVSNEVPSGTIDGSNLVFTTAFTPLAGTLVLDLNGLKEVPGASGSYTISGSTITFNTGLAPVVGDVLSVSYFH